MHLEEMNPIVLTYTSSFFFFFTVVCDRGHRRMEGNHCELCPVGTYQPLRDSDHCIPCGVGLTTAGPGAVSQSQCQSGPVDECSLGTHQCHDQATCVDTEQEYYCLCQPGYTGDGFNCTGEF